MSAKGEFKDPEREAAFQRWIQLIEAPAEIVRRLRLKVARLKATAVDLTLECDRIASDKIPEPSPVVRVTHAVEALTDLVKAKDDEKYSGAEFSDTAREVSFQTLVTVMEIPEEDHETLRRKIRRLKLPAAGIDLLWQDYLKKLHLEDDVTIFGLATGTEKEDATVETPTMTKTNCRRGCGACCVYMSISSPLPGHPEGKPAGVTCKCLTSTWECNVYNTDMMPEVCRQFQATVEICGVNFEEAKNRIIDLEKKTTKEKGAKNMGIGVVTIIAEKWRTMVDNYMADIEEYIEKHGIAAVTVKPHYFYDTSTKTMAWAGADAVIRSSKSGPTMGFYRFDKKIPEEKRSEHTFITFVCDRSAVYGIACLVTSMYEHWEIPKVVKITTELELRRLLASPLTTDDPFPELKGKKNPPKFKVEEGYKAELNAEEQKFLQELMRGKLSKAQAEALFDQAKIPIGFVYTDLSATGKALLWNILTDAEELGGEAMDLDIRVSLQNYGKEPHSEVLN